MINGSHSILAVVCIVLTVCGTELQLKNGTVYKGEMISDNGNYFSMQVGSSRLAINKSLVAKKDGAHYQFTPKTVPLTSIKKSAVQDTKQFSTDGKNSAEHAKRHREKGWTVTLVNGEVFKGKKLRENKRIVLLESNKVPVTIFRNMIAVIDSGNGTAIPSGNGKEKQMPASIVPGKEDGHQETSIILPVKNDTTRTNTQQSGMIQDSNNKIMPGDNASKKKFKTTQIESNEESNAAKETVAQNTPVTSTTVQQPEQSQGHAAIIPSPRARIFVATFADGTSEPALLQNNKSAFAQKESDDIQVVAAPLPAFVTERKKAMIEKAGDTASLSNMNVEIVSPVSPAAPLLGSTASGNISVPLRPPPLPSRSEVVPMEKLPMVPLVQPKNLSKRTDGKHEVVLTNGTTFVGTIKSDGPRSIALIADGAVITILKRLIKAIDGKSYVYEKPAIKEMTKTVTVHDKSKGTLQRSSSVKSSLFRILPVVSLPQGMTVDNLVDSMHQTADWRCRSRAARLLGAMGPWGVSAIHAMVELLVDTAQSGYPVPVWIDSSNVENYLAPGLEVARALAQIGTQGVAELIKASKKENPLVRRHAIFGLGNCFFPATEKAVTSALTDQDPNVRRTALGSLRISTAVPSLSKALKDQDGSVRSAAVYLISKLDDKGSLPLVVQMVKDKSSQVRTSVAEAIGTLGSESETPILVTLYHDNDNFVRAAAVRSLGIMKDSIAVDILIAATGDESAEVRIGAVDALGALRNSRAIPSLYAMLKDKNEMVREKAKTAVKLHTEMPLLIDALDDESETVRTNVAYILWLLTGQDFGDNKKEWAAWAAAHSENNAAVPVR